MIQRAKWLYYGTPYTVQGLIDTTTDGHIISVPPHDQVATNHPFLATAYLLPLMKQTMLAVPVQQRHAHFGGYGYGRRSVVGIEDRFPPLGRSQVDEQRPGGAPRLRL